MILRICPCCWHPAGVNYILGVPTSDDVMLNYQTNAYHDVATIREILGLRPIKEFDQWLEKRLGSDKAASVITTLAVVLGIAMSIGLFFCCPPCWERR